MENVSVIGVFLSFIVLLLFVMQIGMLFNALKRKNRVLIYLIGSVATLLVSIFTIAITLNFEIKHSVVVIITFVLATLFFILASIDSFKIDVNNKAK